VNSIAVGNLAAIAALWAAGMLIGHAWPRMTATGRKAWEKIRG
jgi:hypothetical protein